MADASVDSPYADALECVRQILRRVAEGQGLDDAPIHDVVERMNASLRHSQELLACLARSTDGDLLAGHMVNTAILTLAAGQGLGLPDQELWLLGTCALLYDVGMVHILQQTTQDMLQHPTLGAAYLRTLQVPVERSTCVAEQHHERLDGSGYPQGLKGNDIDLWAQIVGIADFYESFAHPRDGARQPPPQPHQALRQLVMQRHLFNDKVVKVLINRISLYPIGTWVKLSANNAIARVCGVNPDLPLRPIVEVIQEQGVPVTPPRRVDLKGTVAIFIKQPAEPIPMNGGAVP